jgi:hypothetical protein
MNQTDRKICSLAYGRRSGLRKNSVPEDGVSFEGRWKEVLRRSLRRAAANLRRRVRCDHQSAFCSRPDDPRLNRHSRRIRRHSAGAAWIFLSAGHRRRHVHEMQGRRDPRMKSRAAGVIFNRSRMLHLLHCIRRNRIERNWNVQSAEYSQNQSRDGPPNHSASEPDSSKENSL